MALERHLQRATVWQELHARPYVRFPGPAHVFHFAFPTGEAGEAVHDAALARLRELPALTPTYETARHAIYATSITGLGRLVVARERHGEFVAYTFFLYDLEIPFQPFGLDYQELLPRGFLESFDVPPLVATHLAIGSKSEIPDTPDALKTLFEGHTVNGSFVMGGKAQVWSAYRVHEDGFSRIVVIVDQMSPHDLGRTVERLLVIEDAYHLTLQSLPLARGVKSDLAAWEARMVVEMEAVRRADSLAQERAVLDSLLGLASEVENLRARVTDQFAASAAYFSILERRLKELREGKIEHVFRLSSFLMRRLAPANQTHRSVLERLTHLSERIGRAADLLRTRIELKLQEQSNRLLESVDRRARLQLGLQHAVEGLSVIVITYYTLGLLGHILKGMHELGLRLDPEIALAVAAPIILILAWGLIRLIRKGFEDRS